MGFNICVEIFVVFVVWLGEYVVVVCWIVLFVGEVIIVVDICE